MSIQFNAHNDTLGLQILHRDTLLSAPHISFPLFPLYTLVQSGVSSVEEEWLKIEALRSSRYKSRTKQTAYRKPPLKSLEVISTPSHLFCPTTPFPPLKFSPSPSAFSSYPLLSFLFHYINLSRGNTEHSIIRKFVKLIVLLCFLFYFNPIPKLISLSYFHSLYTLLTSQYIQLIRLTNYRDLPRLCIFSI